jgi:hypothetical protein
MFHPGLADTVSGVAIDQVHHGILLNHDLHSMFGNLTLYFEAVEDVSVEIKRGIVVVVADSCQGSADTYRPNA